MVCTASLGTVRPPGTASPVTMAPVTADPVGGSDTPDGRARFVVETPRPIPEPPDPDYPFVLLTGRGTSAQWHTNTRTGKCAILRQLHPAEPYAELHPGDAARLGVNSGDALRLVSRRGDAVVRALVATTVQPGHVFVPMHYPAANQLTLAVFDPYSRQPAYKHCAVRVEAGSRRPTARAPIA